MDNKQLIKIVTAGASMYILFGIIFGCVAGLPINKILYSFLFHDIYKEFVTFG